MNTRLRLICVCAIGLQLFFCVNDEPSPQSQPTPVEPHAGMAHVAAAGHVVRLGDYSMLSRADERPVMIDSFTYDFWIDSTEVTAGEYRSVMGRLPGAYRGATVDDATPVCNVTWFDAVLYCNARSRLRGTDTVYSYFQRDTAPDGSTLQLQGLTVRYDADGCRLPTESEWVYALRGSDTTFFSWGDSADNLVAAQQAWYADNAGGALHPAGGRPANRFGLSDMLGNAMEWVNDVKQPLIDTPQTNYVGMAAVSGDERVVKGGSYAHGIEQLRPASRSDNYDSPPNKLTRYLGFRCASAVIPSPSTGHTPTSTAPSYPATSYVRGLSGITSSPLAKVVFAKSSGGARTLTLVDYTVVPARTTEYPDSIRCHLPTISPDGNWVAFCTRGEGFRDGSDIYVHRLDQTGSGRFRLSDSPAFVPRWWVDPSSNDTFIVYVTSTDLNATSAWAQGSTRMQRIAGGAAVGGPVVLEAAGSWHGGRSADGTYLATGYPRLLMKNRSTSQVRTLFTGPSNGKPTGDTSQVCNVSICQAPGQGDQVMHLDFGSYGAVSSLTGTAYDVHQYLFVTNFAGTTTLAMRIPYDGFTWDHPEWSNDPRFAAATIQLPHGWHPFVVIVGLQDSLVFPAAQAWSYDDDLCDPYLWLSSSAPVVSSSLDPDSLGLYDYGPAMGEHQVALAEVATRIWAKRDSVEIACVGSSQMYQGLNPTLLTAGYSWVFGWGAATPEGMNEFAVNYLLRLCPSLKAVVANFVPAFMCMTPADEWYRRDSVFTQSTGYIYDRNHRFWADSLPVGITDAVLRAPSRSPINDHPLRGFEYTTCGSWNMPVTPTNATWTTADTQYVRRHAELVAAADSFATRGVHMLIVAFPIAPAYRVTQFYGRYGPLRTTADSIIADMRRLEAANPYFHFYDANNGGYHDYRPSEAADDDHVCSVGATKLTARIDSVLQTFVR